MVYLLVIIAVFLVIYLIRLLLSESKGAYQTPKWQPFQEYDSEGYNRYGYNEVGRDRQGRYNRYYDVKRYKTNLYSEDGFLNIRQHPLFLTNHAKERMAERMGITDSSAMEALAFEAYRFGKSKRQLMKSERDIIEEREQRAGNTVILIYKGYCYVFTDNNGLKTVYHNDRVRV